MTEQQPYEVLEKYSGFEVRRYPEHLVAEVDVSGPFGVAGNLAFPTLARYIGGHNRASRKVAMTAPVVQEQDPRSGVFVVGFVMPSELMTQDFPEPMDSSVRTRRVPAQTAAALTFSGRWTRGSYDAHTDELLDLLAEAGLTVVGRPRYARFDPPWTPWFLRRNEVVIPVSV
ncbi:MAG: heme-binding protein [Candidatus Nanopelagicales bacterium]